MIELMLIVIAIGTALIYAGYKYKGMKGATVIISSLLALSIILNLVLFVRGMEDSYYVDFHPRLVQDTKILSSLISDKTKKDDVLNSIKNSSLGINVEAKENVKSMWNYQGSQYPYSLKAGGISFFFDKSENLVRVDHWLMNNSPLYEKNH